MSRALVGPGGGLVGPGGAWVGSDLDVTGTAASAFGWSTAGVEDIVPVTGVAASAFSFVAATALFNRAMVGPRDEPADTLVITGIAASAFGWSTGATAGQTVTGVADSVFSFSTAATGVFSANTGTAASAFGFSTDAAGLFSATDGVAASAFGFSTAAVGGEAITGIAASAFGWATAGAYGLPVTGVAASAFGFSTDVTGAMSAVTGVAASAFGFSTAATGVMSANVGVAASSFGFSTAAVGGEAITGVAASAFKFSTAGTAGVLPATSGVAASAFKFATAAVGGEAIIGVAASAFGWATAAAAGQAVTGIAASAFGFSTAVTAKETIIGAGASAFLFSTAATGTAVSGFTTLQAAVNAASSGATITCPFGVTLNELVTIPPAKINLTINLNTATINGQNVRKQWMIATNTVNLTVKNGSMINAAAAAMPAEFQLPSFSATGAQGLTLDNVHLSGGAAANFGSQSGIDFLLINCEIDNARVTGVSFGGVSAAVVDTCHIHHNNPDDIGDPANEAGGIKVGNHGVGIRVTNCEVNHNHGVGIWADVFAQGVEFDNNNVHHNTVTGISFEVSGYADDDGSYGDVSRIHHNAAWENGWGGINYGYAGILISSAANVEVDNNVSAWNRHEFVAYEQGRPIPPGNTENFNVKDVNSHDNVFVLGDRTEIMDEYPAIEWWGRDDSGPIFTDPGNGGLNNRHWSAYTDGQYGTRQWNADGTFTISEWAATPVGAGCTNISSGTRNTLLTAAGIPTASEAH